MGAHAYVSLLLDTSSLILAYILVLMPCQINKSPSLVFRGNTQKVHAHVDKTPLNTTFKKVFTQKEVLIASNWGLNTTIKYKVIVLKVSKIKIDK